MTEQEMIIAIAELDGIKTKPCSCGSCGGISVNADTSAMIPSYLTSRDAIIPVIEKQTEETILKTWDIVRQHKWDGMLMSAKGFCIALLKATGKWKE